MKEEKGEKEKKKHVSILVYAYGWRKEKEEGLMSTITAFWSLVCCCCGAVVVRSRRERCVLLRTLHIPLPLSTTKAATSSSMFVVVLGVSN